MLNAKDILSRIATALKIESDADLARLFKFHQANLKNWRDRNTIAWSQLYELCKEKGWSFDWLLTGEGENISINVGGDTSYDSWPDDIKKRM